MTPVPEDRERGDPAPPVAVGEATGGAVPPVTAPPTPPRRRLGVLAAMDRPVIIGFAAALGVLGALVLGSALGSISTILAYIALALFLALGLDPIVRMLERRHIPRGAAIGIVFGVFCLIVVALLVFVLPPVLTQIGEFIAYIPEALADIRGSDWFTGLPADAQAALVAAAEQLRVIVSAPQTLALVGGGVLAAVEHEVLEGWLCAAEKRLSDGRTHLLTALRIAEPEWLVQPFVRAGAAVGDLVDELPGAGSAFREAVVHAVRAAAAPRGHHLAERLTTRELELLGYLPSRLTIPGIATRCYVSTNTVKTHLGHIYRKLGVQNRDAAVERARELGLIGTTDSSPVG